MEIYHPRDDELLREMRRVRRERKRKRILWGLLVILVLCVVMGWLALNRLFLLAEMRGPAMGRHPADDPQAQGKPELRITIRKSKPHKGLAFSFQSGVSKREEKHA